MGKCEDSGSTAGDFYLLYKFLVQKKTVSFLTTILGKESPVSENGLSSVSAFSSVGIVYADCIC